MTTMDETTKAKIRELRDVNKLEFAEIAKVLNKGGSRTPMGKPWSAENLRLKYHNDKHRRAAAGKTARAKAKGTTSGRISPDAVRRIAELYEGGKMSWAEIVLKLTAEGFKTATGVAWSIHNARKIYDQRKQILALESKAVKEPRAEDKALVPIFVSDAHSDVNAALAAAGEQEDTLRSVTSKLFDELEGHLGHRVTGISKKGGKFVVTYEATMMFAAEAPAASDEVLQ